MRISILLAFLLFAPIAFAETDVVPKADVGQEQKVDTIKVKAGKKFIIKLDANATTGYEWQISNQIDDALVNFVNSEYIPKKTGRVGSGGKSVWTFKALKAGTTKISFKYVRPWEKDVPPAREVTYTVNIQK